MYSHVSYNTDKYVTLLSQDCSKIPVNIKVTRYCSFQG